MGYPFFRLRLFSAIFSHATSSVEFQLTACPGRHTLLQIVGANDDFCMRDSSSGKHQTLSTGVDSSVRRLAPAMRALADFSSGHLDDVCRVYNAMFLIISLHQSYPGTFMCTLTQPRRQLLHVCRTFSLCMFCTPPNTNLSSMRK